MATAAQIRAAIESPLFHHARAGYGFYLDDVLIYHRAPGSPTGVRLACVGNASIVDPLIRTIRNTSALSPTER